MPRPVVAYDRLLFGSRVTTAIKFATAVLPAGGLPRSRRITSVITTTVKLAAEGQHADIKRDFEKVIHDHPINAFRRAPMMATSFIFIINRVSSNTLEMDWQIIASLHDRKLCCWCRGRRHEVTVDRGTVVLRSESQAKGFKSAQAVTCSPVDIQPARSCGSSVKKRPSQRRADDAAASVTGVSIFRKLQRMGDDDTVTERLSRRSEVRCSLRFRFISR